MGGEGEIRSKLEGEGLWSRKRDRSSRTRAKKPGKKRVRRYALCRGGIGGRRKKRPTRKLGKEVKNKNGKGSIRKTGEGEGERSVKERKETSEGLS